MKLRHSLLLALPLCALPALSFAAEGSCATKEQNIQQQIDYATQHDNPHRVAGLKKALSEVQTNCTEAGQQAGSLENNSFAIPGHLFNAHAGPAGSTWTLVTYTGELLQEIEKRYGPREDGWTLLGVEFHDAAPQIWFPGSHETSSRRHIAIMLSGRAFHDEKRAVYQLAHECVHLLAPVVGGGSLVIEEGLATTFSEDMLEIWFNDKNKQAYTKDDPRYRDAAAKVRHLLQLEPDAIPRLRKVEPAFKNMTAATFATAGLQVPAQLVQELLADFPIVQ
ncbi:periplasmic protein YqjC [Yersinia thracica]|uniref:Periplasmic protein YqjC n=1 Tax=Yersinia thracica TaxID=2890319 RepID=A0A0T9PW05_9GAMM|nr:periplasmic protein YqjC [Yersinia thracica]